MNVPIITYLNEHSECLRVEDIDVFVLCAHNEAADSVHLLVALLQRGHTGDDGLTFEGNVLEHCGKGKQVLCVKLKKSREWCVHSTCKFHSIL